MRFAIISDPHLAPPERQPFISKYRYLVDSNVQFDEASRRLRQVSPAPEFVLFGGDLTNCEDGGCYEYFLERVAELGLPFEAIIGNHDHRESFRRVLMRGRELRDDGLHYCVERGGARFILLDSQLAGQIDGRLSPVQLEWLHAKLDAHSGAATFVIVHHPPVDIGIDWLDELRLQNGEELFDALEGRENVLKVFCGHDHRFVERRHRGIDVVFLPSVAVKFNPPRSDSLSAESPAFLIVDFDGVGTRLTPIEIGAPGITPNPNYVPPE